MQVLLFFLFVCIAMGLVGREKDKKICFATFV